MQSSSMLKNVLQNKEFKSAVTEAMQHAEVADVILFGSTMRGKEQPKDVDVLILFSGSVDKEVAHVFRKKTEQAGILVHVTSLRYEEMFQPSFLAREGIFADGYSFKARDFLSSTFGFSSFVLFRYSLKGKSESERVRFYYALHGRKGSGGVLRAYGAYKFGDNLLLTPATQAEQFVSFFEAQKLQFERFPLLLPKRLAKKEFLEGQ